MMLGEFWLSTSGIACSFQLIQMILLPFAAQNEAGTGAPNGDAGSTAHGNYAYTAPGSNEAGTADLLLKLLMEVQRQR